MTEEHVFIEAILQEDDDHVHRLVYADWLLEHDPAREPLIRRQANLGPSVRTVHGQKLVPIPAGTFVMGSPEEEHHRDPDEQAHQVILSRPFYLQSTPVTVGQFKIFTESTGYRPVSERGIAIGWNEAIKEWEWGAYTWLQPGWKQSDDCPVVLLDLEDALEYCAWLSSVEKRRFRLPTEAEWEYACRAGTVTPYWFGQTLTHDQANFGGGQGTTKVGTYPANAWGLFDMHGNVWEWCQDWYDSMYYPRSSKRNPRGPRQGTGRILRGGSWCNRPQDCRSALRRCGVHFYSRYNDGNTGFRLALDGPTRPQSRRKVKYDTQFPVE